MRLPSPRKCRCTSESGGPSRREFLKVGAGASALAAAPTARAKVGDFPPEAKVPPPQPWWDALFERGGPIRYSGWGQGPNLLWSLDRERVTRVEEPEALAATLAPDAPPTAAVVRLRHWNHVKERCREIDAARYAYLDRVPQAWQGRVGNRTLVVLANAPD